MQPILQYLKNQLYLSIIVFLYILAPLSLATDYPSQDHSGANLTFANGDRIWGWHINLGNFYIPANCTVKLYPYDGANPDKGQLNLHASNIDIAGTLDAQGCGYTGGGGGGGIRNEYVDSANGTGGLSDYGNFGGSVPSSHWWCGGQGGNGDGLYSGSGGSGGTSSTVLWDAQDGFPGEIGGYSAKTCNGDVSTDQSVLMGSGGGGGGYCEDHVMMFLVGGGGGGGAAGGRGGGMIRIYSSSSFRLRNSAMIRSNGVYGGNGYAADSCNGANGGNCSPSQTSSGGLGGNVAGGNGGAGGGGAGGGILIYIYDQATANFETGSVIQSLGAGNNPVNGGTLKIIYNHGDPTTNATISTGRKYVAPGAIPITLIDFYTE